MSCCHFTNPTVVKAQLMHIGLDDHWHMTHAKEVHAFTLNSGSPSNLHMDVHFDAIIPQLHRAALDLIIHHRIF